MNAFETYLILQLDSLHVANVLLMFYLLISGIVRGFYLDMHDQGEKVPVMAKRHAMIALAFLCLGAVVPSTKTALAMFIVPAVTQNEEAKKIPGKVIELINEKLDGLLKKG